MIASIVIDLGFGDSGKGLVTDYLCSKASNPIVIRFSGGQQAGHTVMLNNKKHIHSSYGSGTLRGIPSYFTEHTCIYPNSIDAERKVLLGKTKKIEPLLYVHPFANLTTPFDVAWNRIRERHLGHGSCGLGIGATMKRNIESPYKIYAIDFTSKAILIQKLEAIKDYYKHLLGFGDTPNFIDEVEGQMSTFLELCDNPPFEVIGYEKLGEYYDLIFEGSQGIMLDRCHGIFPNVTYANTTSQNVMELIPKLIYTGILVPPFPDIYYVTRCYQTRHGMGWMSNESPILLENNEEEINVHNEWQKNFRVGELDYDLLNYALKVDSAHSGVFTKHLVVTCLDQRPGFEFDYSKLPKFNNTYESTSPYSSKLKEVCVVS